MSYTNEKQEEEHDSSYKSTSKTEDLQLFIDSSKDDMIFTSLNENADSAVSADVAAASSEEEDDLMGVQDIDIDEKLEEKLKKHGLNRRNAKTIIHELLNDEHVRGLFKNLDSVDLPEAKNLRSTQRKASSEKLKFTDLPLPEDDEEDDEYHPEISLDLDNTFDTEASQDTQSTLMVPAPVDSTLATTDDVVREDFANSNDSFMTMLQRCDSTIQAIQATSEQEMIALRTRSKHPMLDVAMAEIETAFKPPDVTDDMYKPSGDDDWHKWLAELMLDDEILTKSTKTDDDDDCEQDPDYDFIQSDCEETNDREDYRNDHGTHIPKKEVQDLLQERHIPTVNYQGQLQPVAIAKNKLTKSKVSFSTPMTLKKQLKVRRKRAMLSTPSFSNVGSSSLLPHEVEKANRQNLNFSAEQIEMLKTQLRQHVQLLTQLNLLSRNVAGLSTLVHETHALLKELQQLDEHDKTSFNITSSYFDIPCLSEALDIAQLSIKKSDYLVRLSKQSRTRGLLPLQRNIGVIMATSAVFPFISLLPHTAPREETSENARIVFTSSEDSLLVLGVAQMQGHALPWSTLVHRYLMPCKQPDQIRTRFSNTWTRHDPDNPIRLYKKFNKLPPPPSLSTPDIMLNENAGCLLSVGDDVSLPDWLLFLKREIKENSSPKMELVSVPEASIEPETHQISILTQNLPQSQPPVNMQQQLTTNVVLSQSTISIASPIKSSISIIISPQAQVFSPPKAPVHPMLLPSGKGKRSSSVLCKMTSFSPKKKRKKEERKSVTRKIKMGQNHEKSAKEATSIPSAKESRVSPTKDANQTTDAAFSAETLTCSPMETEKAETEPSRDTVSSSQRTPDRESHKLTRKEKTPNKSPASTNRDDFPAPVDEEEDLEDVTTEDDFDEEIDLNEGVEEISEEENDVTKKQAEKKTKKKDLKVKWKSQNKTNTKLGGRLHRLHPGLLGKRKSKTSDDSLSKSLRESAERVKMLEEETIVQLDPLRGEKEMLFAQGYLKRMEETLRDKPEVFVKVLETLCEFDADTSQAPPALFNKISKILEPWPELLQGFAPFLMPEQAHKCGLLEEQQVYARARKFLRQLEIRFHDNPQQINRILNTFKTISETGIYREKEVKNTILSLLKCDPYLQEEFLMFFDDERPPESRLHGDYEEITWCDDLLKESYDVDFEHVYIPAASSQDTNVSTEAQNLRSPVRHSKSPKEVVAVQTEVKTSDSKTNDDHPKEQEAPVGWDESRATDAEDENADSADSNLDPISSFTPEIALISEDALSCSPFKRHNPPTVSSHKPPTPTAEVAPPEEVSLPTPHPCSASSSLSSKLPSTPSASKSSVDEKVPPKPWTFEEDFTLLSIWKEQGATHEAFEKASSSIGRSEEQVRNRFHHLMNLMKAKDNTDTDTTSHYTDSESEELSAE